MLRERASRAVKSRATSEGELTVKKSSTKVDVGVPSKNKASAKVLSSEMVFQGRVFGVRRDRVVEPQGVEVIRELVTHPGSVVVLPVFPGGRILLIRQYRHVAGQHLWELVAGRRDGDENFVDGAERELEEETGYRASKFKKIMDIFPSPGFVAEHMVIFVAKGLTKGVARPEADESITARIVTLAEAERWVRSGKIRDAKSVAGILFYARFLARSKARRKR
jgi:ADP-ribose pyrophosphatase